MVLYDEKPAAKVRKRKREVMMDRSSEEKPNAEGSFLICDDSVFRREAKCRGEFSNL
jgi:hypothetical protein